MSRTLGAQGAREMKADMERDKLDKGEAHGRN